MATRLYDEAFVKKLQGWTQDTNLKIYSPTDTQRLFEVIADAKEDKPIELPIICLRRPFGYRIKNTNRQPLAYSAKVIEKSNEKVKTLNAIPIELTYQIDIYTRYYAEADEFVRNLVFNLINYPTLTVVVPYLGENLLHDSTLELAEEVEDTSDIPERFVLGNFTRLSLGVTIPNAYLWDIRVKGTTSIGGVSISVDNGQGDVEEDEELGRKGIVIRDI